MRTTHLSHLVDAPAGPARRLADRLVAIVEAMSVAELEQILDGVATCPEHPRRCGQTVFGARTLGNVHWACATCGAMGIITGWEGTDFDRRRRPDSGAAMPASALTGPVDRWPKASGNFTTFAKPLIDTFPPVAEAWRRSLHVPEAVWNAVVLQDFAGQSVYMDDLRRTLAGTPAEIFLDVLIARKRRLFAADWRTFHVTSVDLRGGTMWVNVEARDGRRSLEIPGP